jgi:hypothetical protein
MNEIRRKLLHSIGIKIDVSKYTALNWFYISKRCVLSEEFIREFANEVFWDEISDYQILSEEFIREFQHLLNWHAISSKQNLSDDFLLEFQNKVDWYWYFVRRDASFRIMKKFLFKSNHKHLSSVNIYHLSESQQKEIKKLFELKQMFVL